MDSGELEDFYASEYRQVYQGKEGPSKKDLRTQQGRASALLKFFTNTIPNVENHLDIGCSAGTLLLTIRNQYGNHSVGVEPGDAYRDYAKEQGLMVYADITELESANKKRFDLISMAHVLEHLTNPVGYLTSLRERFLTRDGFLLIEVPNLFCHDSFEIAHMISFSKHTLDQTIQKSGFKIIKFEAHGRPRSDLLPLYLTLLARPGRSTRVVQPENRVTRKRQIGMLRRRIVQKLFPKRAWIRD
jgi:SAM-dependent methyltransferase